MSHQNQHKTDSNENVGTGSLAKTTHKIKGAPESSSTIKSVDAALNAANRAAQKAREAQESEVHRCGC